MVFGHGIARLFAQACEGQDVTIPFDRSPMVQRNTSRGYYLKFSHRNPPPSKKGRLHDAGSGGPVLHHHSAGADGLLPLAAPAFLLVKLDLPPVTHLLRGVFNAYFLVLTISGVIGTLAFAVAGRLTMHSCIALIAAFAVLGRRMVFLRRLDAEARRERLR